LGNPLLLVDGGRGIAAEDEAPFAHDLAEALSNLLLLPELQAEELWESWRSPVSAQNMST
jgi:hypothetical protein